VLSQNCYFAYLCEVIDTIEFSFSKDKFWIRKLTFCFIWFIKKMSVFISFFLNLVLILVELNVLKLLPNFKN
jgi:hypothetical protein